MEQLSCCSSFLSASSAILAAKVRYLKSGFFELPYLDHYEYVQSHTQRSAGFVGVPLSKNLNTFGEEFELKGFSSRFWTTNLKFQVGP